MKKVLISAIAFFWPLSVIFSQDMIKSAFDTDNEEWTTVGGILYYRDQGGNPGGFIEFEDDQDGAGVFVTPAKFLGDLSGYNLGSLSFDLINTNDNGMDSLYNYGNVTISSSAISASRNVVLLKYYSEWTSFTIPLTAEEWGLTPSGWDSLLSDVTEIKLQADAQWDYYDRTGIDNFSLVPVDFGVASGELATAHSESILISVNPNPVREFVNISWDLPHSGRAQLNLYDLTGRCVRSLINDVMPAGCHEVRLSNEGIQPGLYLLRVTANGVTGELKIVVLEE